MISFTCTCGKTYQLPERHAGREVRCNQCGKTLVVPKESQTEPVTPLGETASEKRGEKTPDVPVETKKSSPLFMAAIIAAVLIAGIMIGMMLASAPMEREIKDVPVSANVNLSEEPEVGGDDVRQIENEKAENLSARFGDGILTDYAVKTLDGASIQLSLDGDPVAAAKAKQGENVLDALADAVNTEDEKTKDDRKHERSFRIDSASGEELRLIWPGNGQAELSGDTIKEFQFSLYVPDKPNAAFNPGKPEGIDKILVLSSIRLRLVADNGIIEFGSDREHFVRLMERCRSGWLPIRIPIGGDETWKRTDFGLAGPLVVERIELRAKPTGSGVTFWIDNLAVVE